MPPHLISSFCHPYSHYPSVLALLILHTYPLPLPLLILAPYIHASILLPINSFFHLTSSLCPPPHIPPLHSSNLFLPYLHQHRTAFSSHSPTLFIHPPFLLCPLLHPHLTLSFIIDSPHVSQAHTTPSFIPSLLSLPSTSSSVIIILSSTRPIPSHSHSFLLSFLCSTRISLIFRLFLTHVFPYTPYQSSSPSPSSPLLSFHSIILLSPKRRISTHSPPTLLPSLPSHPSVSSPP